MGLAVFYWRYDIIDEHTVFFIIWKITIIEKKRKLCLLVRIWIWIAHQSFELYSGDLG